MEVGVRIDAENAKTGEIRHTASAYLTFVALTDNGKPCKISNIIPENDDEKRRYEEGKVRHIQRMKRVRNRNKK